MMNHKRVTASCMAAVIISTNLFMPVKAAAPRVQVDETMYVNMDYYGKTTDINVVKGCNTNGITQYTDYGKYDKVVNMSDKTQPVLGNGTVSWVFPEKSKRFYYQCTMPKNSVELPWTFDVSYKLNGNEADASKLAGASGLVEINVKADPNEKAKTYYKNNMMLTVVFPVDMEKCYSVDAPGSQLQSVGNNTVATFMALPGEEGDFTVRIGTDDFESVGVMMMMMPGTASALDHIKDLKEAKDTWREDGDRMYDSMNALLRTIESTRTDVTEVEGGLGSLESARAEISKNRKQIESLSTQAIAELQSVTEQTSVVIPYLETARNAVSDINDNMNAISNTMEDTQDELDSLYDRLKGLKNSLDNTSSALEKGVTDQEKQALMKELNEGTAQAQQVLDSLGSLLDNGRRSYSLASEDLDGLDESLKEADTFLYSSGDKASDEASKKKDNTDDQKQNKEEVQSEAQTKETEEEKSDSGNVKGFGSLEEGTKPAELLRFGPSGIPGTGGVNDADFEEWQDEELEKQADYIEKNLRELRRSGYSSAVRSGLGRTNALLLDGSKIQNETAAVIQKVNSLSSDIGTTGHKTAKTVSALRDVTDELINLLDDSRVLINTMDGYVPSMLDCLGATEELMNRLNKTMQSTHDMLSLVNETLIAAGDSLDAGTKDSLSGMRKLLDKNLKMLDHTTEMREASEGMKKTVDEQLDKFEDENNFLNVDPEADKVSFTSSKNPSPNSLQIVVRTDEISDEDKTTDITDLEDAGNEHAGPFTRMWRVITKIFRSIVEIFQNR